MERKGVWTDIGNLNRDIRETNRIMSAIRRAITGLVSWLADVKAAIAKNYLVNVRGIDERLVDLFLTVGDIYEEAKHHNVVFVGRDLKNLPRYAHCRGTADRFRLDVSGSDKSYGFGYQGKGDQLCVFEAPIDLLSFINLFPKDWQTRSYLSLGGVVYKALERYLAEHPNISRVYLCLDSDLAGEEPARGLPGSCRTG